MDELLILFIHEKTKRYVSEIVDDSTLVFTDSSYGVFTNKRAPVVAYRETDATMIARTLTQLLASDEKIIPVRYRMVKSGASLPSNIFNR
jgi:hypothetical protein